MSFANSRANSSIKAADLSNGTIVAMRLQKFDYLCQGSQFRGYFLAKAAAAVLVSVKSPSFLTVYRPEP
jgi:hypothetical protein